MGLDIPDIPPYVAPTPRAELRKRLERIFEAPHSDAVPPAKPHPWFEQTSVFFLKTPMKPKPRPKFRICEDNCWLPSKRQKLLDYCESIQNHRRTERNAGPTSASEQAVVEVIVIE